MNNARINRSNDGRIDGKMAKETRERMEWCVAVAWAEGVHDANTVKDTARMLLDGWTPVNQLSDVDLRSEIIDRIVESNLDAIESAGESDKNDILDLICGAGMEYEDLSENDIRIMITESCEAMSDAELLSDYQALVDR